MGKLKLLGGHIRAVTVFSQGKAHPQAPRLSAVAPAAAHQVENLRQVAAPAAVIAAAVAAAAAEPVEPAAVTAAAMAAATAAAVNPSAPFLPPSVVPDPARLVAMKTPTETAGAHHRQHHTVMAEPGEGRPGNWES